MKWVHAAIVVALALSLHLAIVLFVWPRLLELYPNHPGYMIVYRSCRVAAIAFPALFLFAACGIARIGKHGRAVAGLSSLFLIGLIGSTVFDEVQRLRPYYPRYSVEQIMKFVDIPLFIGVMFALFVVFIVPVVSLVKVNRTVRGYSKPIRSKTAAFGDAEWATMEVVGQRFPADGMLALGERYRVDLDKTAQEYFEPKKKETWGKGGTMPLMAYNCDTKSTHGVLFSGSGSFKTTGYVVPMCMTWPNNSVIGDPSQEVFPMVKKHRETMIPGLKRKVFRLDPADPESGFNVLDWIGTSKKSSATLDVENVIEWMAVGEVKTSVNGEFFVKQAKTLLRGLLAHICLHPAFPKPRTLRTLRELISVDKETFRAELGRILRREPEGSYVKLALGQFVTQADVTFSGVYSNAGEMTEWLAHEEFARLLSGNSFKTTDLAKSHMDVVVCIDLMTLDKHPGLARTIYGAMLNALYHMEKEVEDRVLILIDESARLGYMKIIETARDAGRKYMATLVMVYQSVGQVREQWSASNGFTDWLESTAWQSFSAISDIETAEYLSKRCGYFTQEIVSFSKQVGSGKGKDGLSASTSLQQRALILPDEITSTMRGDEQLLFMQGVAPIRCGRPIFFRRPEMAARVEENRFDRTGRTQNTRGIALLLDKSGNVVTSDIDAVDAGSLGWIKSAFRSLMFWLPSEKPSRVGKSRFAGVIDKDPEGTVPANDDNDKSMLLASGRGRL